MTRKLKVLCLAFVAVLALGSLSASTATAEFHSETEHTIYDGKQPVAEDDVFTFKAGTLRCQSASYSGTSTSATTQSVTVTPSFSECTAFGFVNATVDVNGCTYTLSPPWLQISCGINPITVTAFNCTVQIGSQTLAGVSYINHGSGVWREMEAWAFPTGVHYTQSNKSFPNCTGGSGSFSDGTYTGAFRLSGTNTTGNRVGIWS